MTDEALKPCPFCGCAFPAVGYDGDAKTLGRKECITARCRQCGGETRKFSSQAEAITAWNTRTDDNRIEALQARVKVLEEALRVYAGPLEWTQEGGWGMFPVWADGYPGGVYLDDNTLDFGEAARAALQETER